MSLTQSVSSRCSAVRQTAGFSLIEMLVAMVLVSLIMIVALEAFDSSRRLTRKNLSVNEAQQQGSYGMQELAVSLRRTGYQLGPTFAILANSSSGATLTRASWDNYSGGATPAANSYIWQTEAAGAAPFIPVTDTDGITVKYGDDQPPLHACVMPAGVNTELDLFYDAAYASYYPKFGDSIDVITSSNCYGIGDQGTNVVSAAIAVASAPNTACGDPGGAPQTCASNPDTCYCKDPLCRNQKTLNKCYHVTFTPGMRAGCDLCDKGPTYVVVSKSASFWISTEDRTGIIYKGGGGISRPILVGRYGLTAPTRIVANDIEDLQLAYLLNKNNVLQVNQTVPVNTDLPLTRALRINLVSRAAVPDLGFKNYNYCDAKAPSFRLLFSRPALENHIVSPVGTAGADYCDGLRRVVFSQLVNLPNMTTFPLGRPPTI